MLELPFKAIYSHPPEKKSKGRLLLDHSKSVAEVATEEICTGKTVSEGSSLQALAETAAWTHDLGKATTWFQQYLNGNRIEQSHRMHAPISALAAYHVTRAKGASREEALVALTAVAKHHGMLPDVANYTYNYIIQHTARKDIISRQADNIASNVCARETVDTLLRRASAGATTWTAFADAVRTESLYDDLAELVQRGPAPNHNTCSRDFYDAIIVVWGELVTADKIDAAALPRPTDHSPTQLTPDVIGNRIRELQSETSESSDRLEELNRQRDTARETVTANAEALPSDGHVATITLPTGLGKTLASLQAAATLRERKANAVSGSTPGRIIYVLPYTSIVDQTVEEVRKLFALTDGSIDEFGDALTVHHHLAETATRLPDTPTSDEEPNDPSRKERLLGETWRSGVVITTYVQLFESLVRPTNAQTLKLPSLRNAVIILDEPQTLPLDWWLIVRRVVKTLTDTYDATVFSMTATQPHVFTADDAFSDDITFDATPLVESPKQYFDAFSRVDYAFEESLHDFLDHGFAATGLAHETAAKKLVETIDGTTDTSVLAICNTVASARELSYYVTESLPGHGYTEFDVATIYSELLSERDPASDLSADELVSTVLERSNDVSSPLVTLHVTTRHRPCDRRVLLEAAKTLATGRHPFLLISTQLIEAGVDVSFRHVFRDVAPLPSIIQAGGRCNRSFEWDRGTVTLWRLASPTNGHEPSRLIYAHGDGYNLLDVTRTALQAIIDDGNTTHSIRDTRFTQQGTEQYYSRLVDRQPGNREYVELLERGEFATLRKKAEYIDSNTDVDVVVSRTSIDSGLINEYQNKREDETTSRSGVRNQLYDRTVALPQRALDDLPATVLDRSADGHPMIYKISTDGDWWSDTFGLNP